jgi:tetratricopeptide (TPR) repeat protein
LELADLHTEMGELAAAGAQLAKLDPVKDTERFDPWRRQQLAYYRAHLALARGDHETARAGLSEVADRFEKRQSKITMFPMTLVHLARAQQALGRSQEALSSARRAIALSESFVEAGAPSYLVGLARLAEADVLAASGERAPARESYRLALDHLQRTLGRAHPATRSAERGSLAAP